MSITFVDLCHELAQLQVQLLRREGRPSALAKQALHLLRLNRECTVYQPSSRPFVPLYLRSCASLLPHVPQRDEVYALEALDHSFPLAKGYVEMGDPEDVNECSTTLRSLMGLDTLYSKLASADKEYPLDEIPFYKAAETYAPGRFAELITPTYDRAMSMLRSNPSTAHTLSVLTLLEGTSKVYGSQFRFTPATTADINSLLPTKNKIQMEAKVQRCYGARELLSRLQEKELSRLDAGMCLSTMASTGFYDSNLCNYSCSVLYASHPLLSSPQVCQIVYALGVLQHRHVHQRFFSSLINAKKCTAEGVLKHVMGLAMLRLPPQDEKTLMDGVFLHALRGTANGARDGAAHARYNEKIDSNYELSPLWYIDIGHALSCLGVQHAKFKLTAARKARRSIARLSTAERCKLLYALGGIRDEDVPATLQDAWRNKVHKTINITALKLEDIHPQEGPCVMNALLFCGIRQHPRVPQVRSFRADENPVDALLKTWAATPREQVLRLAERIETAHFDGKAPSKTLTNVVQTVAGTLADTRVPVEERHRLAPLCAAVDAHVADMTTQEALGTLEALQQMGILTGNRATYELLLKQLWQERDEMSAEEKQRCARLLQQVKDVPMNVATDLYNFTVSN